MLSDRFYVEWQLVGQSSLTCGGILGLLQATQLKLCDVDVVLVSAGVNDVTKGTKPENWSASLIQLTSYLQQQCHAQKIIYTGLPPMHQFPALPQPLRWYVGQRAKTLDRILRQHCIAHNDIFHLRLSLPVRSEFMAKDGFHPSASAARLWAEHAVAFIL